MNTKLFQGLFFLAVCYKIYYHCDVTNLIYINYNLQLKQHESKNHNDELSEIAAEESTHRNNVQNPIIFSQGINDSNVDISYLSNLQSQSHQHRKCTRKKLCIIGGLIAGGLLVGTGLGVGLGVGLSTSHNTYKDTSYQNFTSPTNNTLPGENVTQNNNTTIPSNGTQSDNSTINGNDTQPGGNVTTQSECKTNYYPFNACEALKSGCYVWPYDDKGLSNLTSIYQCVNGLDGGNDLFGCIDRDPTTNFTMQSKTDSNTTMSCTNKSNKKFELNSVKLSCNKGATVELAIGGCR